MRNTVRDFCYSLSMPGMGRGRRDTQTRVRPAVADATSDEAQPNNLDVAWARASVGMLLHLQQQQ